MVCEETIELLVVLECQDNQNAKFHHQFNNKKRIVYLTFYQNGKLLQFNIQRKPLSNKILLSFANFF